MAVNEGEITRLLVAMRDGKREAVDQLLPLIYEQLRARTHLNWKDRNHFFAVAATAMRQVLVDQARRRQARKRGRVRVTLDPTALAVDDHAAEIIALNEALSHLFQIDKRLGLIAELRFFGGLSGPEVAEALGMSERTLWREWRKARALLHDALRSKGLA